MQRRSSYLVAALTVPQPDLPSQMATGRCILALRLLRRRPACAAFFGFPYKKCRVSLNLCPDWLNVSRWPPAERPRAGAARMGIGRRCIATVDPTTFLCRHAHSFRPVVPLQVATGRAPLRWGCWNESWPAPLSLYTEWQSSLFFDLFPTWSPSGGHRPGTPALELLEWELAGAAIAALAPALQESTEAAGTAAAQVLLCLSKTACIAASRPARLRRSLSCPRTCSACRPHCKTAHRHVAMPHRPKCLTIGALHSSSNAD